MGLVSNSQVKRAFFKGYYNEIDADYYANTKDFELDQALIEDKAENEEGIEKLDELLV